MTLDKDGNWIGAGKRVVPQAVVLDEQGNYLGLASDFMEPEPEQEPEFEPEPTRRTKRAENEAK